MILKNLLYILQSENYYFKRFLRFAYSHFSWWNLEDRQKIVWTQKIRALWIGSALIFWMIMIAIILLFGLPGIIFLPLLVILLPIIVGTAMIIISPMEKILKRHKTRAAQKIILNSKIKVIGITGSYGKTSTKEILTTILAQKHVVICTPENVNTDLGIAEFILQNKDIFSSEKIFIVEMGAYQKGEITKSCQIVRPQFSILTGINESHLERFGSLENIIDAKFELAQNTQDLVVLNFDDVNVKNNYAKFNLGKSIGVSKNDVHNVNFKENFQGLEFVWQKIKFETKLLADHNISLILLCAKIAQEMNLSVTEIANGVSMVLPIEHRLQPIYNSVTDITVIDDSYNGNYNGIVSGLEVLQRAKGRKVVLTPGLVELGKSMKDIHGKIGKLYTEKVDLVLLIKSPMTDAIINGLENKQFSDYKIYETTNAAHVDLPNVLKQGDTIIFQNDLTDNYF